MVHAVARITIPSERRAEALGILSPMVHRTRYEPGCISCGVYQEMESEDVILVEDLWNSEEDLERHLRSDEYFKVLLVFDMASTPPEIRFDRILKSTGFETVEKERMQQ